MALNTNLLGELARLASKYEPDEWSALLDAIKDERRRAEVVALLEELATVSGRSRLKPRRGPRKQAGASRVAAGVLRERLAALRETDPTRADVLDGLWVKLRSKELLGDMPSLRAFAEATGIKGLQAPRREQAVHEVVLHLMDLPKADLEHALERASKQRGQAFGQEYERWVNMIMSGGSDTRG